MTSISYNKISALLSKLVFTLFLLCSTAGAITVFSQSGTNGSAGSDTIVCENSIQLNAEPTPPGLKGHWNIPGNLQISDIHNPKATLTGLVPGNSYTVVWTVMFSNNQGFSDELKITCRYPTSLSDITDLCLVSAHNSAGITFSPVPPIIKPYERILWSVINSESINNDSILNRNSVNPQFKGLQNGVHQLEVSVTDTVTGCGITRTFSVGVIPKAEVIHPKCLPFAPSDLSRSIFITGRPAEAYTNYNWKQISENGKIIGNSDDSQLQIENSGTGTYEYIYSVEGNGCKDTSILVFEVVSAPTLKTDTVFSESVFQDLLVELYNPDEKILWHTLVPGISFSTPGSAGTIATGIPAGANKIYATITGKSGCTFTDSISLVRISKPDAGPDQCNSIDPANSVIKLSGTPPSPGENVYWFHNDTLAGKTYSISQPAKTGKHIYTYIIENSETGYRLQDQLTVINIQKPDAGSSQCISDTGALIKLKANLPDYKSGETGRWLTTLFNDINNRNPEFRGLKQGVYRFGWMISQENCSDTAFTKISVLQQPYAGADILCVPDNAADSIPLQVDRYNPRFSHGSWSADKTGSVHFADFNSPHTLLSISSKGVAKIIWTVSDTLSASLCKLQDTLLVSVISNPEAGQDQCLTLTSGLKTVSLRGSPFDNSIEKISWRHKDGSLAGNIPDIDLHLSKGPFTFFYEVENLATKCTAKDSISVKIISKAQAVNNICEEFGKDTIRLSANIPAISETGRWYSYTNLSFNYNTPSPDLLHLRGGVHKLKWEISRDDCRDSSFVTVSVISAAQIQAKTCVGTTSDQATINLYSSTIDSRFDVGKWSVSPVSVTRNPVFTSPESNQTNVIGVKTGLNRFYWTVRDTVAGSACMFTDSVDVSVITQADTGPDTCIIQSTQPGLVILTGNLYNPIHENAIWGSKDGMTFTGINKNTAQVQLSSGIYTFFYTINNKDSDCKISDTVKVRVSAKTTLINSNQCIEHGKPVTLNASPLNSKETGQWYYLGGIPAQAALPTIVSPGINKTGVNYLENGTHKFKWVAGIAGCKDSATATVSLVRKAEAISGSNICQPNNLKNVDLSGNEIDTTLETSRWYVMPKSISSGTATIYNPEAHTTRVDGLKTGVNYFIYSINLKSDPTCLSKDTVSVTLVTKPDAGNDLCQIIPTGSTSVPVDMIGNLSMNTEPNEEKIQWFSQDNQKIFLTGNQNPSFLISKGRYEFYWKITNSKSGCSLTDTVILRIITSAATNSDTCITTESKTANLSAAESPEENEKGYWTMVAGNPKIQIDQKGNMGSATISNLQIGVHRFKWTINNESCSNSSIQTISVASPPKAGPDQCLETENGSLLTSLSGTIPQKSENILWYPDPFSFRQITIDSISKPITNVHISSRGSYRIILNITDTALNHICNLEDTVSLTLITKAFSQNDSCLTLPAESTGTLLKINGVVPANNEIATWNSVPPGNVGLQQPGSMLTKPLTQGRFNFTYTISSKTFPSCSSSHTTIIRQVSKAIINADNCIFTATGSADIPLITNKLIESAGETGKITSLSQLKLEQTSHEKYKILNAPIGVHSLVFTANQDGCSDDDTLNVNVCKKAKTGPDRYTCFNKDTLIALPDAYEYGEWSANESNEVLIANALSPVAFANNLSFGKNEFTWTVKRNDCPDEALFSVYNLSPGKAEILNNETSTCFSVVDLKATSPSPFNGSACMWRVISQPAGNMPKVLFIDTVTSTSMTKAFSPFTKAMYLNDTGTYTFVYQVYNHKCDTLTDTLRIRKISLKSSVIASDSICKGSDLALSGLPEGGRWMITRGTGKFADSLAPNTFLRQIPFTLDSIYVTWILDKGQCFASATKKIRLIARPDDSEIFTLSDSLCETDTLSLFANKPNTGKGTWRASGKAEFKDKNSNETMVTMKEYGTYSFSWIVSNPPCKANSTEVKIKRYRSASTAILDSDTINICGDQALLTAKPVALGTGKWLNLSGIATISNVNQANSLAKNLSYSEPNRFIWSVTNGNCISSDTLVINARAQVSKAEIEGDTVLICSTDELNLKANKPETGKGRWIVLSRAILTDSLAPITTAFALPEGFSRFVWKIQNNFCLSTDTLVVRRDLKPDEPYAGYDLSIYGSETRLSSNRPQRGKGIWSTSDTNIKIYDVYSPSTTISGLPVGESYLVWTLRNGICPPQSDTVKINRNNFHIFNAFSPNNDGKNTLFEIPGLEEYSPAEFTVLNRWGQVVYHSSNYQNDWGGKSDTGKELADDTYYYILKLNNNETHQGNIILKR